MKLKWIKIVLFSLLWMACTEEQTPEYTPCPDKDPNKQVFWGDLHVHTTRSLDAKFQGTINTPEQAYKFARGEELGIGPYVDGASKRNARLLRPLDFAVVTDHAEFFGEQYICETEGVEGYNDINCEVYREGGQSAFYAFNLLLGAVQDVARRFDFCGPEGEWCVDRSVSVWQEMQQAAAAAQTLSPDCEFTSFVGYEWTGAPTEKQATQNLHRNVIFANENVPDRPISYLDEPFPEGLWQRLAEECVVPYCDVVTIPHNSNLSSGKMFDSIEQAGGRSDAFLTQRAFYEPLLEIIQHKGASECLPGSGDEQCAFEIVPWDHLSGNFGLAISDPDPQDFARNILKVGLQLERIRGVNPYRYGFVGSTDTHLGTPGFVQENAYPGHGGAGNAGASQEENNSGLPDDIEFNPGGLTAIWAEENSRASLFRAIKQKEVYATSGPRISLRVFAGAQPMQCGEAIDFSRLYQESVPMGATLDMAAIEGDLQSIHIMALAQKDPGVNGQSVDLAQMQIVKTWVDDSGESHEQVYDVAGREYSSEKESVERTCEAPVGESNFCVSWQDPSFNADQFASYYVRVLEAPTCRWSTLQCKAAKVDCNAGEVPGGYEPCCEGVVETVVQERAWSSPIWVQPSDRIR